MIYDLIGAAAQSSKPQTFCLAKSFELLVYQVTKKNTHFAGSFGEKKTANEAFNPGHSQKFTKNTLSRNPDQTDIQ